MSSSSSRAIDPRVDAASRAKHGMGFVEYALLVTVLCIVMLLVAGSMGERINNVMTKSAKTSGAAMVTGSKG